MGRVNFLHVEVKVYPASVEEGRYADHDWDTLMIAEQPVLSAYENLFDLWGGQGELVNSIVKWINKELLNKGKEIIYQNCPKAPK